MVSLVWEGGRCYRNRKAANRYAVAVLTVAVRLQDEAAEGHTR